MGTRLITSHAFSVCMAQNSHGRGLTSAAACLSIALCTMDEKSIKAPIQEETSRYGTIQTPPCRTDANEDQQYEAYPERFYILAVFAIFCMVQGVAWLTFGTIPTESRQYFGLTDDDVTLLAGSYIAGGWICQSVDSLVRNGVAPPFLVS